MFDTFGVPQPRTEQRVCVSRVVDRGIEALSSYAIPNVFLFHSPVVFLCLHAWREGSTRDMLVANFSLTCVRFDALYILLTAVE